MRRSDGERAEARRRALRRARPGVEAAEVRVLLSAAAFRVTQDWGSGFQAAVSVTNTQATPVLGWTLGFDYPASIDSIWDAKVVARAGNHYTIRGTDWNRDLPAGGTVAFGFVGSPGSTTASPANWKLNGVPLDGSTGPPSTPALSIADVSLAEGRTGTTDAAFAVTLSDPATRTVAVNYATAPGTARAGSDFQDTNGTLTFAPGETRKTIAVKIDGDTTHEADETFAVALSGPVNATLARAQAVGTILDDDPLAQPAPAPGGVSYAVTGDWGSGFQARFTIKNTGTATLTGWTLDFDLPAAIGSIWDAQLVGHSGSHYVVKGAGWNDAIAPGATVSFGLTASPGGGAALATNYVLRGDGGTSTPATPLPAGIAWPQQVFAPYVDATLYPTFDIAGAARDRGLRFFTLAFVVADPAGKPAWGGYSAYGAGDGGEFDTQLKARIAAVRGLGGDVMVSFGGAANRELAEVLTDINALKAAYRRVIDAYKLTNIDFDIEGGAQADRAAVDRRSQALADLQAEARAAGRKLDVRLTLPVLPAGLTVDGRYVVQSALRAGVTLTGVNIMAMDYGDAAAPSPAGRMGDYAIQAATGTFNQLRGLYGPAKADAQLWALVGVTPMIGMNDVQAEIFDQNEARELLAFAQQKRIGLLSFWSLNRDRANPRGAIHYVESTSSSLAQQPFEFALIDRPFTGG